MSDGVDGRPPDLHSPKSHCSIPPPRTLGHRQFSRSARRSNLVSRSHTRSSSRNPPPSIVWLLRYRGSRWRFRNGLPEGPTSGARSGSADATPIETPTQPHVRVAPPKAPSLPELLNLELSRISLGVFLMKPWQLTAIDGNPSLL